MTGERVVRRLAAILAADVVGYSRLVGRDENGTVTRLKAHRTERLEPTLARHGGRLVKLTGDGALVEFPSAVDALNAAIAFQQAMTEANRDQPEDTRIVFRIGLHLGDLIVEGDDLYGDGVNVAARLEAEAPAGGIVISRTVHEAVAGKLKATFDDLGSLALKNIERPVQAFGVKWEAAAWPVAAPSMPPSTTVAMTPRDEPLALPDKPSIAVLAFTNMSGDPEQEYFTDGITEDIITELSRFRSLFVIARNSSFSYKGKSPDLRQVGRDLGVRYVLEGSIRRASKRIRVTGQLIDTLTGNHIWAERYDRVLEDIFSVHEEVTQSIVRAIAPHISDAELAKVRRRRPDNLSAYEIAVRASAKAWTAFNKSDRVLCDQAIEDAQAALAIDPDSTIALIAFALAHYQHSIRGTAVDRDAAWRNGMAAAARSIEVDRAEGFAHVLKGLLLALVPDRTRTGEMLDSARRGHELNPHDMRSLVGLAYVESVAGNPEQAIEHSHQALRVSPRDPFRPNIYLQLARAHLLARQYAEGVACAVRGIDEAPGYPPLHVWLAANYVGLGEFKRARAALAEARSIAPEFVENLVAGGAPYRNPEHLRRVTTFLRIAAGLEDPSAADALR